MAWLYLYPDLIVAEVAILTRASQFSFYLYQNNFIIYLILHNQFINFILSISFNQFYFINFI